MDRKRRLILAGSATTMSVATLGLPSFSAQVFAPSTSAGIDVHIELRAVEDRVAIRPGVPTRVWRYSSTLLRGEAGALEASAGHYLGPIIRLRRGQRVRIDLINGLPEPTIVHWHGLHVPDDMDGHPRLAIAPGERYAYEFTVVNRAGSYWFHPHPHGRTGKQVYFGLAGLLLVSDDEEAALGLPAGPHDMALVIQDRSFDDDNQFVYPPAGSGAAAMPGGGMRGGGMMDRGMRGMTAGMMGVLGDEILVNGKPDVSLDVERRAYRLRLLNASNTRIYKLAWSDRSPLTVIGTDGGLLGTPLQRGYVMLAPAERADLWVDFGRWPAGSELTLQSLAFEGGMNMGGMMTDASALPDGAPFPVLRLRIGQGSPVPRALPQRLSVLPAARPQDAVNAGHPKVFELTMGMMRWGINGKSFEMLAVSPLETVKLGTQEVWEFRNDAGNGMMGMMAMAHAMHVHGLQFRVIGRSIAGEFSRQRDTVKAGLLDEGWKDTVLVMPGERVRIQLRFAHYPGLFLYHCHMLEHEDSGMMRNYRVEA